MADLKFALRMLLKTPFVTAVAVVSLALGIGANAAIFSLFDQLLLESLPVSRPDELVNLAAPGPKPGNQTCNQAGDCDVVFSYPMFRDLQQAGTAFSGVAAHRLFDANLAARGRTLSGRGLLVSGSYFPLLGLRAALGRLFTRDDDRTMGEPHAVVLGYGYWAQQFASDPHVLNQAVVVNGQPMTVVGVAPRGFDGTTIGAKPLVYIAVTMAALQFPGERAEVQKRFEDRRNYWLYLFARLRPGASLEQGRAEMNARYHAIVNDVEAPLQKGMSAQTLARFRAKPVVLAPGARGQSSMSREARAPLTLLVGVTAFVLLIACANIANLLLARSAARAGEMAVRLSIGAGRWRLVRQLLVESSLLAVLGGAVGLVVARWTLDLIASLLPPQLALTLRPHLDGTAIAFAAALTLGTALLFGLFPALHSTRPDLVSALKGQAGQPSGARSAARFRTSLATAQIALSMALLAAAGLFTRSLLNVTRTDLGLKVDHVITFAIAPGLNGYSPERTRALFERLEDRLAVLPGVTGVSDALVPLLAGDNWGQDVAVEGFDAGPDTDDNSRYNEIGPRYFRTLGVPLVAGREFTRADGDRAPKVAIVNEAFAKKFKLGRDAVGKRIGSGKGRSSPLDTEIVGLVRNAKYSEVKDAVPPVFFRPYRQDPRLGSITFFVRTALPPDDLLGDIPKVVARLDPNLPVDDLRTMPEQIRENVFIDRFISVLSAAFAVLATLLAAIGLYGVLAYTVAQRTREIGLRMALGAAPGRMLRMVLAQVGRMTIVGGAIGLVGAIWLGRLAASLLYQLRGSDPLVLAGAAIGLTLVALAAGFLPARRASLVEPMQALRYE